MATTPLLDTGAVAKTISEDTGKDVNELVPTGRIEYTAEVDVAGAAVVGWKLNAGLADSVLGDNELCTLTDPDDVRDGAALTEAVEIEAETEA